jgi:hypothetical protein
VSETVGPTGSRRSQSRIRLVVGVAVTIAFIAALAGCGWFVLRVVAQFQLDGCQPEWLIHSDPRFCLTASIQGDRLVVIGHTTLPDGAIVETWVATDGVHFPDPIDDPTPTVHAGQFTTSFDLSLWPAGEVTVSAIFRSTDQPADIVALYGINGASLEGPATRFDYDFDPPPKDLQAWVSLDYAP